MFWALRQAQRGARTRVQGKLAGQYFVQFVIYTPLKCATTNVIKTLSCKAKAANMVRPLSNAQVEILESFSFELETKQLLEFRQMLIAYFADKVTDEIDLLFEDKGWSVEDKVEEWGGEHMRIPYKPAP